MARSHGGGSRSGGGRSSFGGGSRSHGSSIRSSRRSGGHMHMGPGPRRPHHHGGIHIFYSGGSNGTISPFGLLVAIGMFFVILFGSLLFVNVMSSKNYNDDLLIIEQSYRDYQDMISYAEEHPSHQTTATIKSIEYDTYYKMYYLVYTYKGGPNGFFEFEQETFAQYTYQEISNFHKGDTILIAVDNADIDVFTETINIDYKNVSLENDPEYKMVLKSIANNKRMTKIYGAILAGIVIIIVVVGVLIIKKSKNKEETSTETITPTSNASTTDTTPIDNDKYCSYCGSKLPEGKTKCPLCGASNNKR